MSVPLAGNIPVQYDYKNSIISRNSPSTYHSDDHLTKFFTRYLLQKAMSVFKWELPEEWDQSYFLYTLYCWGFLAVIKTDKYGVIPQGCGLSGYNIFYRPTHALIQNPLLRGILRPEIGKQCTLFKLQPDYGGIMDLVTYYADLMSVCATTAGLNAAFSKLSYVFFARDKKAAESFKTMIDKIMSGEAAVVQDKSLLMDDGTKAWEVFSNNLSQNYIANDVLDTLQTLENKFSTAIGIPNANTDKKERLITDEVNANNIETYSNVSVWLEELQKACDQCNAMFYEGNRTIWVDWRNPPASNEPVEKEGATDEE